MKILALILATVIALGSSVIGLIAGSESDRVSYSFPHVARSETGMKGSFENTSDGVFKSASEYAKLIDPHLGVPPMVDLRDGIEIPIFVDGQQFTGDPGIHCCDNPSLQMGDCMSGSVLQRYEGRTAVGKPLPHVVWVSFGRHDGRGSLHNIDDEDMHHSVQMIGYNRQTGATAFFESGDNRKWVKVDPKTNRLVGKLPGVGEPKAFNRAFSTPRGNQCVQCHQADPFIHNPFIDAAKLPSGKTVVPKIADLEAPYFVVGASVVRLTDCILK